MGRDRGKKADKELEKKEKLLCADHNLYNQQTRLRIFLNDVIHQLVSRHDFDRQMLKLKQKISGSQKKVE